MSKILSIGVNMGKTTRKTIEEVEAIFRNRGLYLEDKTYKMKCHDNNGYTYSLSYNNVSFMIDKILEKE